MISNEANLLEAAIAALNGWRETATSANINLDTVTLIFPSGDSVRFIWDSSIDDWRISTPAS